jgi:hypothetical protein
MRKNLIILSFTIILILLIELLRLNLVLSLNSTANTVQYEYQQDQVQYLTEMEKGSCAKLSSLIVYPEDDPDEMQNIASVLQNMQFLQDKMTLGEQRADYQDYDLIIILGGKEGQVPDLDKIIRYMQNGGHLLYLGNGSLGQQEILISEASLFGITALGGIHDVTCFDFKTEVLSGMNGERTFSDESSPLNHLFQSLQVNLTDDCLVHVEGNQDNPVLWERTMDGHVMVMNTGSYDSKHIRGLLTGAISVFLDTVIYPVTQSAVWQIVDIPVDDPVEASILNENYSRNFSQYIMDIWWNDMVSLMKKYELKYTVAYIGFNNSDTSGPFVKPNPSVTNWNTIFKSIVKGHGELSYQGYNHHPLLLARANQPSGAAGDWTDSSKMSEALQCSLSFLTQLLPNYHLSAYVPPNHQLDDEAIAILIQAMPNLKTISGVYFEPVSPQAQHPFVQEFSVDERYGVAFPQVTASCFQSDELWFDMASVVTTNGIISHAIEADEILYSDQRKGLLWEKLFAEYGQLLKQVEKTYGWLSHDTVSTAAEKLKQADGLVLYYSLDNRTISIVCDNFGQDATLILVSDKDIVASQGCAYEKIDSIRYLVTMHEKTASLEVGSK